MKLFMLCRVPLCFVSIRGFGIKYDVVAAVMLPTRGPLIIFSENSVFEIKLIQSRVVGVVLK